MDHKYIHVQILHVDQMCTAYDTFWLFFLFSGRQMFERDSSLALSDSRFLTESECYLQATSTWSEVFIQTHPTANEQSLVKTCYATFECASLVTIIMIDALIWHSGRFIQWYSRFLHAKFNDITVVWELKDIHH